MTVVGLTSIIDQLLPEPHAGLLAGIIFGTKENLPDSLYRDLTITGTLHIVALSGMNISIIAKLVSSSLLWFVSRRIVSLLTIVLIIGYILLVGPSPSVVRAGIMGTLVMFSVVAGRQSWSLFFLFLASATMLIVKPAWLFDLSFQLSVLSTLGIILFGANKIAANRQYKPGQTTSAGLTGRKIFVWFVIKTRDFMKEEMRVTLSAQLFTMPLIFFSFGRLSLISPMVNVAIGWTIPYITVLGFAVALLGLIDKTLAFPFAWSAWMLLEFVIRVIRYSADIPFAGIDFGLR